jgi:hypothetical protein
VNNTFNKVAIPIPNRTPQKNEITPSYFESFSLNTKKKMETRIADTERTIDNIFDIIYISNLIFMVNCDS